MTFYKRGLWICCRTCWLYPRDMASSLPSNLLGGSSLLLPLSDHLTACLVELFLGALACFSVPCDNRGSKMFGGTALLHLGELTPCLLFSLFNYWEGLDVMLPFIFYGIFTVAIFIRVLWGGEDKIEVIEEFVSNVLRGFYYWLTLSRSDFADCHMR